MMAEKAQSIQERINTLQEEVHRDLLENATAMDDARNKIYTAREKEIESLMTADVTQPGTGLAPDFWAKAIISGLETYDQESDANTHFLGPYDKELLSTYLTSMKVEHTPSSQKLVLHFKPNPFFEESSLWAELFLPVDAKDDNDDEDEHWVFSGVTWKPSHGPLDDDEDSEDEPQADGQSQPKRSRDGNAPSSSTTVGPSMLEVFSSMPPHPTQDEEFLATIKDEEDDEESQDELEEAIDNWEDEMQDREKLLSLLIEDIYQHPVEAILAAQTLSNQQTESDLPQSKKNKLE